MQTAFISHPDCLLHDMGTSHPESPARLSAIEEQLIASGLMDHLQRYAAPLATREQLARVHTPEYIAALDTVAPSRGMVYLDPDTAMNPHSLNAAYRAAGAVILATDLVIGNQAQNAFCSIRPPGHHAMHNRAMGFCLFNNIAVGVAHALAAHGLERVAVVDFDVHHGNGTEDIFRDERYAAQVMMVSIFQHPFYPGSGIEGRSERMVNIPLAAGSNGEKFRTAVNQHWLPALEAFKPQMLFISAGFDAHRDDELAALNLVEADYAWVTASIKEIADKHAQGRIVSALEGGYELHALGRSVAAHLKILGGL